MRRSAFLRVTTLLSLGAGCVHELRYLLAYGGDAGRVMDHEGHAYLSVGTPLLGVLVAAALAQLIIRALGATGSHRPGIAPLRSLWAAVSAALMLIYSVQELGEGWIAAAHPAGLTGVVGNGGWIALPLTIVVGGLISLLVRAARRIDEASPPVAATCARAPPAHGEGVLRRKTYTAGSSSGGRTRRRSLSSFSKSNCRCWS